MRQPTGVEGGLAPSNQIGPAELGKAIPPRLEGPPGSVFYRLGLLLVAAAMVLLPLVYLGLIALAGYGVYWHATEHTSWLAAAGVRMRLVVYAAPIAAGAVVIFFLLKPLFSKPAVSEQLRPLRKEEAPLLFALVRRVAAAVGAPAPDRIHVDCQVNASAGRNRHEGRKQLVLTVGLPLVAGLSLRELAGVLAHEFGHFGQGAGTRLSGRIRQMNFWFARLVYERDSFDQALAEARAEGNVVALFAGLGTLGVWIGRGVLWVLMHVGHAISCIFMRQMEYDADRYEIALAGSASFAGTARKLAVLNYATELVFGELHEAWREGRLGDDLPQLIASKSEALPEETRAALEQHALAAQTALFDTHPSDRQRIARAEKAALPGVFDLDAPASVVFADFSGICRQMTLDYYEDAIGPEVGDTTLVSASELMEHRERLDAEGEAVDRYFPVLMPRSRPFALGCARVPEPTQPKALLARLEQLHAAVQERFEPIVEVYRRHRQQDDRQVDAEPADALVEAGLRPDAEAFHLPSPDARGPARARERAQRLREEACPEIDAFEALQRERLLIGLSLLSHPKVKGRLGDRAVPDEEVAVLVQALAGIEANFFGIRALFEQHMRLGTLLTNAEGREEDAGFVSVLCEQAEGSARLLEPLLAQLSEVPFPFEHGKKQLSAAEHLLPEGLPPDDVVDVAQAAALLLERTFALHTRIVARLVAAVEPVEALFGLGVGRRD
jgi:Zn-dependent protease with chaperone function